MGTDIWSVFQARKDGAWVNVESMYADDRHYYLFSHLAGVRNGTGFAGIKTGDPVTPISEPRGIPVDVVVDEDMRLNGDEDMWLGDHSHSWLTADEILSHDWGSPARTAYCSVADFKGWDGGKPDFSTCGDIWGGKIVKAETAEEITAATTHVRIHWITGADEFQYFLDEVKRLKDLHGEVRMIFGFDS